LFLLPFVLKTFRFNFSAVVRPQDPTKPNQTEPKRTEPNPRPVTHGKLQTVTRRNWCHLSWMPRLLRSIWQTAVGLVALVGQVGGWAADELVTKFEAETSVRVVLAVLAVPIVLPDRKCWQPNEFDGCEVQFTEILVFHCNQHRIGSCFSLL